LAVTDGVVTVVGDASKKISYGKLIGGKRFNVTITATGTGWDMKVAPEVKAKNPKDYKIVGASVPRVDLPAKVAGKFTYTQDLRVPGMLHGRVVRPPVVTSKPASVDEESVKQIPGIVKIVQEGTLVGVVAKTEWSAIQAAKALKVTWSEPGTKLPANPDELYAYLKNTKSFRDQVAVNKGNPASALSQAAKTFEATYRYPFQLHGMIGPSCAVADVRGDKATVWTGTQGPFRTRGAIARLLGFAEKNVRVIYVEGSGCYGRYSTDDGAEDAALLSRAVRRGLGLLRPLQHRRRGGGRGAALARRGQARARPVDARGGARVGAQGAGAARDRARGRRRKGKDHCLGFHGSELSLDCGGGNAAARIQAGRPQAQGSGKLERHPVRRPDL
ncbi:MAG: molybdopterin-dependent oxidoreductase, partial [Methylocystis sp.]|nr:molybdopterin-dependent oxidoreductase [Methylocystis sp.]